MVVYHLTPADVELLDQRYGGSNLDVENTDVPYTAVVEPPIPQH